MTVHHLVADLEFDARNAPESDDAFDAFDAFVDRLIDELDNLQECDPGIVDPDVAGSLAKRTVSVTMGVDAGSLEDAMRLFSANVRAALHAAECDTSTWPRFVPTEKSPNVTHLDSATN
ncbi:hypothetical protein [Nocardiopsis sp. CNT312]|uniref:hypothetical protein n=1 Tax=Nocardiopsis sp. CNT312 TaxID=1137268 RepID=UPI00048CB5A5|nr:hypothetical protein [Nocardiopsis sp. CNT312]